MVNRFLFSLAAVVLAVVAAIWVYTAIIPTLEPDRVLASGANAATSLQGANLQTTGIQVTGEGRVRIKPDMAKATIGVDITATTLANATNQANSKIAAVISKLKSLGIADSDLQTVNYSVNPITKPLNNNGAAAITGYRVSNQIGVTIRKLDDLGKILDSAVAAGANSIYGISFGIANPQPFEEQARAAAVKDAQTKAGQLAKNANVLLGKIIAIDESAAAPRPLVRAASSALAFEGAVPVQTGEMEIVVDINVLFAIQ